MIAGRTGFQRSLAVLLGLLVALASIGTAFAHANLVRSDPAIGANLPASPPRIQLWFSEAVEPTFSKASVLDANRQPVDLGDSHVAPNDPSSLIVGVKPGLPSGVYVVAWTTQSKVDGHVVRGTVPFGVGTSVVASDAANQGAPQGAVSGTPLEMVLRWLILLAATTFVGSFPFWLIQATPLTRLVAGPDAPPHGVGRAKRWQSRVTWGALGAFILGNLALLVLQTATAADLPAAAVIGAPLVKVLTSTQFGGLWIARIILALVMGQILVARQRSVTRNQGWDRLAIGVGFALLGTITLTSHSASVDVPTPLGVLPVGVVVDWLHLTGVAAWVGGLAQLVVVLVALDRGIDEGRRTRFLGELVPRFSWLAGGATALIAVTGLGEGLIHVGTLDNLLGTAYGQALGVKLIVGVPLAALAIVNHLVVRPALVRARATGGLRDVRRALNETALLRQTVRFEYVLVAGIIGAVGVMTSLSPAQQIGTSASTGPLSLQGTAGSRPVTFVLAPGRPGSNSYVVEVRDPTGQLAPNIERVALRFTFLDSDLGVSETVLQKTRDGHFEGSSSDLAVAGRWQTEVVVRPVGQGDDRASFTFDVTPTGARVGEQPSLQVSWLFWAGVALAVGGLVAVGRGLWLRTWDVRRAVVVAICGIGLVGTGGYLAGKDVLQAQSVASAQALAQSHPATPRSVANGALIFRQNCVACHGLDARGNGPLAPTLNPRPADLILHVPLHPDSDLYGWISDGFPGSAMPAFRGQLTDQERWDVLNYLKSLVGGGTTSTTSASPSPTAVGPSPVPTTVASGAAATPTSASTFVATEPTVTMTASLASATTSPTQPTATAIPIADGRTPQQAGDLKLTLQVTPRIFQPADLEVDVAKTDGQTAADIQRVDVQTAMVGMNHGARGIVARPVGPGRYASTAMLFAMQGPWLMGVRIQRANGTIDSAVFLVPVPKDTSNGPVSQMAARPPGTPQIEDIAVYPGEVSPPDISVVAGRPVRLEVFYVDSPRCGSAIRVQTPAVGSPVDADGLAELTFTPSATGRLQFKCDPSGLMVQPVVRTG